MTLPLVLLSLTGPLVAGHSQDVIPASARIPVAVSVPVGEPLDCSGEYETLQSGEGKSVRLGQSTGWFEYEVQVPVGGRYQVTIDLAGDASGTPSTVWLEDYVKNEDGRTYDVTGPRTIQPGVQPGSIVSFGSPLDAGIHRMRLHVAGEGLQISGLNLSLLRRHQTTPRQLTQNMTPGDGDGEWKLVWSDEFDGEGLPDEETWTCDVGDWGWGNREPQFYTEKRLKNARQEGGNLIIEAHRDDEGFPWTSARLTTRGKLSFLYGRIEIRAKVPSGDGAWAAGWLLGDAYRDEISWPYCGEIDVCEAVGREIDDETGDGINHASCHTRAYYFKQGNHISNRLAVTGMATEFLTYTVEWEKDEVRMYVDDTHYYTYDKVGDRNSWPFAEPQNLILNLAMGGGMGGAIDPELTSARYEIDYVRVYERP